MIYSISGLLLLVVGILAVTLIWGMVYNWYLVALALPLILTASAAFLIYRARGK